MWSRSLWKTVSNTAIGFTSGKITPATGGKVRRVVCTLETDNVRIRTDGTDPTSSEGHLLEVGQSIVVEGYATIAAFRAIRTSTDATLKVTYET